MMPVIRQTMSTETVSLPEGTVTVLSTDVVGSTLLNQRTGGDDATATEPVLAMVCALPTDLTAALPTLQNAEFIHPQARYPMAEYAFARPLTQAVAIGSTARTARSGWRRRPR
jgi:hypothetical protein